jgi:hypothetical protein
MGETEVVNNIADICAILGFVVAICATFYIPQRIMINQVYEDLMSQYRSAEMGIAIASIFWFYVHVCKRNVSLIKSEYVKIYYEQTEPKLSKGSDELKNTLHFQRRLVEQWYWQLATLRYDYRIGKITKQKLQKDFTASETKLLAIIYYMGLAAKTVFDDAGDVNFTFDESNDNKMEQKLYRLYEESEAWE